LPKHKTLGEIMIRLDNEEYATIEEALGTFKNATNVELWDLPLVANLPARV
jgi:hypothetical protein